MWKRILAALLVATTSLCFRSAVCSDAPAPGAEVAGAFRKVCAAQAASATAMGVPGKDGWYFFKGELRHLGVGEFWGTAAEKAGVANPPENRDPLAAILNYKSELDKQGIELIVMPVPPKAVIYPDMLPNPEPLTAGQAVTRVDETHQNFYRLLREQGVVVLDLVPEFLAHRSDANVGPLYCRTDTHWSGAGCVLAAHLIATELQSRAWLKEIPKKQFVTEDKAVKVHGDLTPSGTDEKIAVENLRLRFVGQREGANSVLSPLNIPDASSPVLIISDSHGLVFNIGEELFARGAGFPDNLSNELGFPVDLIASRGDGVSNVRIDLYKHAKTSPAWLAGKKVVVWCFSAREFTESTNGWRKIPVKK